jgi:hypothetical protein
MEPLTCGVKDLIPAVSAQTVTVPSPGRIFTGRSAPAKGAKLPILTRIPTVFSPFHAGVVFEQEKGLDALGNSFPIHVIRNMTVLVSNSSFAELHRSGFMDFFSLKACFTERCAPSPASACCGCEAEAP